MRIYPGRRESCCRGAKTRRRTTNSDDRGLPCRLVVWNARRRRCRFEVSHVGWTYVIQRDRGARGAAYLGPSVVTPAAQMSTALQQQSSKNAAVVSGLQRRRQRRRRLHADAVSVAFPDSKLALFPPQPASTHWHVVPLRTILDRTQRF